MSTLTTTRVENSAGDGVDVAGLAKIEDTGKNICTAWVVFDAKTTPPTIKDSFNISSVDRTADGKFTLNFGENMDNINYALSGDAIYLIGVTTKLYTLGLPSGIPLSTSKKLTSVDVEIANVSSTTDRLLFNTEWASAIILGGKA